MSEKLRGFTLIEILVVILIISIIIGIAVIVPRSNNEYARLKSEATRLAFLFNAASEQALLSGTPMGFSFSENQYSWWHWNREDEQWQLLDTTEWRTYRLPNHITLSVQTANSDSVPGNNKPQSVFYTDGLMTPMKLTFSDNNKKEYQLTLDTDGITPIDERQ